MSRFISFCSGLLLCLAAGVIHAQNLLNGPESVEYDEQYQRYITSNWIGGNLVVIDSTGTQSVFHTVNDGARPCGGSEIVGDTFYSASAGRVAGYRLDTGALVMDMLIPGTALLNTMVSDTLGYLYVTDANPGKIYKIDIDNSSYTEFVSAGLVTPVGLFYDGENDRLLVTGTADGVNGTIHAVDLADSSVSLVVNTGTPLLDALIRDRWGNY